MSQQLIARWRVVGYPQGAVRRRHDAIFLPCDKEPLIPYQPADNRYQSMVYRRCGRSGLRLPAISLGLRNSFGDGASPEGVRGLLFRAFDLGITHFDLANNYERRDGKTLHFYSI